MKAPPSTSVEAFFLYGGTRDGRRTGGPVEEQTPIVGRGTYLGALDATRWREGLLPRTSPSGPWTRIEARTSINDTRTPQCLPACLPACQPPSPSPPPSSSIDWMNRTPSWGELISPLSLLPLIPFSFLDSSLLRSRTDGWMDEEDGDAVGGVVGTVGH